eukprot:TRINITY_DN20610_c0_g1_i1.p1 TRINITY_DN20610_c0_g1~~TRINITY_DN20610_c0_g1_i1.p1  ORF type:complete len:296 (+),score=68.71 TRINITY_DN20610_c0_g1_i1:75-962(+)
MGAVQSVCCTGSSGDRGTEAAQGDSLVTASSGDVDVLSKAAPADFDYVVTLDKTSGFKLGIDCGSADGQTLIIESVTDGLVQNWNQDHPDAQVKTFDRIVEVNGTRGNEHALLEEMRQLKPLQIKLKRGSSQYIVLEQKYARAGADKASDLVGGEVPMGTIITEMDRQEIPGPDVERVKFDLNGAVGWLSVTEADGSEVLRFVEEREGYRIYEVLEQKFARADADKNSDLVGEEVPTGAQITCLESKLVPSPAIVRVQFMHNGVLGWLSVVEPDGSEVLGNLKDQEIAATLGENR